MNSMALLWYFAFNYFFLLLICFPRNIALQENMMRCIEKERQALLSFKQGVIDEFGILSSWKSVDYDCCNWRGVQCSNDTKHHHVIKLDLHASFDDGALFGSFDDSSEYLAGEVGSSLTQLSHLNYLDLSSNEFDRINLEDIGLSLTNLNYLNLSHNGFQSVIPPHLGNLSKLSILDLGHIYLSKGRNFGWVSSLSSLKHLDLSWVNFHGANDWASAINKLPVLQSLSLRFCNLAQPTLPSHSYTNFSKFLVELDLSGNYDLNSSISWLINFKSLVHLNLGYINLKGLNFDDFGQHMTSLVFLHLASTQVDFRSVKSFGNLCKLNLLDLSYNNISGLLSDFFKVFPPCVHNSLQSLYLQSNKFIGFLSNFTMLPSLKELDLSSNMLNGTIPKSLGELSNLELLRLRSNLFEGEVSEIHFSKFTHLKYLDLSYNSLSLNFKSDWIPPFQLKTIHLSHCSLGPLFPRWLQTQISLYKIDISFAEISDIIPLWFWNNLSSDLEYMYLFGNKFMGEIPNLSIKFKQKPSLRLYSNKFVGRIPSFLFLSAVILDLSNNKFSGDLTFVCEIVNSPLEELDLSNNQLSGQLPNCLDSMPTLRLLNLFNNYFSGELPHSMSNLSRLSSLVLRNNQFSGGLHHLFNMTWLQVIDAMNNSFFETIPSWIGLKLPNLVFMILKSNHFHGNLPSSICNLTNIKVLDISSNNISGSIPTCIYNFTTLTKTSNRDDHDLYFGRKDLVMMYKRQERLITLLEFERSIDLSSNHLTGIIPHEITQLIGLITLNLSRNEFTGQIPYNMGRLQSLESLDLSRNHLCGPIPSSISQISRLPILDLSYNNLSGKIPIGTQLQSFPTSSYEGNPYLCGDPLKKCFEEISQEPNINNNVHVQNKDEDEDKSFLQEFFICMAFGYIVGFWGIFGTLVFHRRWRHAYFKFIGDLIN